MRISRITATSVTTAALALGLAACGSGGGTTTQETKAPDAGASSAAPAGKQFAGKTITVWRLGEPTDPKIQKYSDDLEKRFEEETGATVNVQWIPWTGINDRWTTAAAGGEGPDVTEIGNTQVLEWQAQDALLPITDVVEGNPDLKGIPAAQYGYETVDGDIYALPWGGGTRAVLYRKDWFDELKIAEPKSWDELVAAAKKIQEGKGKDVDGFAFVGGTDANYSLSPFVWSAGGDFAVQEGGKWVGKVTEPAFKEGFQFYTDLVAKHGVNAKSRLNLATDAIRARFANNKVGMYITAPWDIGTIETESKGKVKKDQMAFFTIPGKDGSAAPAFQGGNDIAVWKDSKEPDVAKAFVAMAAGKEFGTRYAIDGGLLPYYAEGLQQVASDPALAPFANAFSQSRGFPNDANWNEASETKAVLQNAARSVIEGKKDVDTALADANKELEEILNQ
ncbi:extracellular solute-binding protein [Nonomuraea sp. NPDC050663]|uniref:extracellular solute-binding protein n=1 Tax=Nonomuraea sp. NPDC050663 TaxID=3364370 RepID=UPI0037B10962